MNWKEFFKPTKITIITFLILMILSYWFFASTSTNIFPCKVRPVIPNPPAFKDSFCGLGIGFGAEKIFTLPGYLMIVLMLLILPYLLGCMVNSLIKRR